MATDLPFRHKNLPTFQFYRMDLPLDKRPVRFCQNLTKRVRRQFASRMGVSIDVRFSVKMVVHRENAADWLNTTIGIGSFISVGRRTNDRVLRNCPVSFSNRFATCNNSISRLNPPPSTGCVDFWVVFCHQS